MAYLVRILYYYYFLFSALFGPLFGSMKANLCTMGKPLELGPLPQSLLLHEIASSEYFKKNWKADHNAKQNANQKYENIGS
jgi:hypothetical protein